METIQNLRDKIFLETKNVLQELGKIKTMDDFLLKQDLFRELNDKIAFLYLLEKNKNAIVKQENDTKTEPNTSLLDIRKETPFFKKAITEGITKEEKAHKIKLAHIKNLKTGEDLSTQEKAYFTTNNSEQEPSLSIFRLDLNDKIAFTQKLFNGNQEELNQTIHKLNTFKTVDEAKEYLSELYYKKNWKKADEYAQRLWTLVESKFM